MINKKILFRLGIGLMCIGLVMTLIGFTMAGFQIDKYQEDEPVSWYRTIRFG